MGAALAAASCRRKSIATDCVLRKSRRVSGHEPPQFPRQLTSGVKPQKAVPPEDPSRARSAAAGRPATQSMPPAGRPSWPVPSSCVASSRTLVAARRSPIARDARNLNHLCRERAAALPRASAVTHARPCRSRQGAARAGQKHVQDRSRLPGQLHVGVAVSRGLHELATGVPAATRRCQNS